MTMNYVVDGIWLGSEVAAIDIDTLQANDITVVVSVELQGGNQQLYPTEWHYLHLGLRERKLISYEVFEEIIEFIKEHQTQNRQILIHCSLGVSRSPSIVLAYLMYEKMMTPVEALQFLKEQRPNIKPAPKAFESAIEFAYPNTDWFCKICGRQWIYSFWENNADTYCACKIPDLMYPTRTP